MQICRKHRQSANAKLFAEKFPENQGFPGILSIFGIRLTLAELRSTSRGFEAVLHQLMASKTLDFQGFFDFPSKVSPSFNSMGQPARRIIFQTPTSLIKALFMTGANSLGLLYFTFA